jgi:AcrR family transcriptional regulator
MAENAGLRLRNKQLKLERIRQAAWQLFEEKGFEATTIRDIAELAQIGTGTLFLYLKDKYELVVLLYLELLEHNIKTAPAKLPPNLSLLDELTFLFGTFFHLYYQNLALSKVYIQAMLFSSEEGYRHQSNQLMGQFLKEINQHLEQAQVRGEISQNIDPGLASRNFFGLYFSNLIGWLDQPVPSPPDQFLTQVLRPSFELQIQGFQPQSGLSN